MRTPDLGIIPQAAKQFSREENLELFRRMCLIRSFESGVKSAFDAKRIPAPVYLSFGQESIMAALSMSFKDPALFGQHRCHDMYLAYGGDPVKLIDELLGRESGISKGMGGSSTFADISIRMYGHDNLMGDQIPVAVGYALGSGNKTLGIMGDASAEEDYVLGALAFAAFKKLPTLFIVIDNNLSILTKVEVRRNWGMVEVVKAFGMSGYEIADDPWTIMLRTKELEKALPALFNIHTIRHWWHSGTGTDGPPEWDRFNIVKQTLNSLGFESQLEKIEAETQKEIESIWKRQLAIQ